jgi:hypothetical protein
MGMKSATENWTVAALAGDTFIRAAADGGTYTNASNAYDGGTDSTVGLDTFASTTLSAAGSSAETFSWTGTANNGTGRILSIKWGVSGFPIHAGADVAEEFGFDDVGGTYDSGFRVTVLIEKSEDAGSSWTTIVSRTTRQATSIQYTQVDVTDSLQIADNLQVRTTLTYSDGDTSATLRVYDMNVNNGGTGSDLSMSTGVYYALSEYDSNEGDEGPASIQDSRLLVNGAGENAVTVTLPSAASNSRATHWRIYRTTDGGSVPSGLFKIDAYIDPDKDTRKGAPLPLLRTVTQQDIASVSPLYFPQNTPPPRLAVLRVFEGSMVGLSADFPRSLYYSMAGKPQSWPEINVIDSFPFKEHDELLDCVSIGSVLILAARGTIMRLTGLPRVVNSVRDSSRVEQIGGAPGCVGRYALTSYSVQGEPRAAWVSHYGLYATDGDKIFRISDSIDWSVFDGTSKSNWGLYWDANRLCLVMTYSSVAGGANDRYYLIHMAPEHRKSSEQPKWTGPHYGSLHSMSSGQVGSTHRIYGGHSSNGIVYVLDNGTTDSSSAYSGTQVPLIIKTGKAYAGDKDWAALDARLYHTDFGNGETCTLDWEVGSDDEDGGGFTLSQSVSLAGHKGTQLDLSQRCQWAQATITHTGSGTGAIRDLVVETAARGRAGAKRVA